MSTNKETVDFILETLGNNNRFSAKAMFGEYALYADQKVVGLICDNCLYIKILPASSRLKDICDQDSPYPGAKPYYLLEEGQLQQLNDIPSMLFDIAKSIPEKKPKGRRDE